MATAIAGGSSTERSDERGAAHLYEHLWFRGPRLQQPSFDALVDRVGGQANAVTAWDDIVFLTVAPRGAARSLIEVEGERLSAPWTPLDDGVFGAERAVVRNEVAQRYEGRQPALQAFTRRLLPTDDPYTRPVSGTDDDVASLTAEVVEAWARRTVVPGNTAILVVGDLEPDTLERLIHGALDPTLLARADRPDHTAAEPCPTIEGGDAQSPPPPAAEPAWTQVEAAVPEGMSGVAWTLPATSEAAARARAAAAMIRSEVGRYTPLDVRCDVHPLVRTTVLTCLTPDPRGRGEALWRRPLLLADRLWLHDDETVTDRAARTHAWWAWERERGLALSRDEPLRPGGRLLALARTFHHTGALGPTEPPGVEDVARLGHRWLTEERMRGLVLVPAPSATALESGFHSGRGAPSSPVDLGEASAERLADLVYDPGFDGLLTAEAGSRRIWVLPWEGAARTRVSAVYPATAAWSDEALRERALRLLADPWRPLSAGEQRTWMAAGATVDDRRRSDHLALRVSAPVAPSAVQLLARVQPPPVPLRTRAEDQTDRELLLGWRQAAASNARWVAAHHRWTALSDGLPHPWLDPDGVSAWESVRRPRARGFLEDLTAPDRPHLVAVVSPAEASDTLDRLVALAGSPGSATPPAESPSTRPASPRSVLLLAPDEPGPQTRITLECHVDPGDPVAWWLLEDVLDDALHQSLRNDLGITYGVDLALDGTAHGPTLRIDTRVPHDTAALAVRTLLDSLARAADSLDPAVLDRHRLALARRTALQWQAPQAVLNLLEQAVVSGRDPATLPLADQLAAVGPEDLARLLAPCSNHEAVTAIGDGERIEQAFEATELPWKRHGR